MKLLLVQSLSYVPTHGGANKGNRALIEALAARGHDCRVVTLATDSPGPDALQKLRLALAERKIAAGTSREDLVTFQLNRVNVSAVANSLDLRAEMKRQMRDFKPDRTLISCEDPGQAILEAALETRTTPVVLLVQTTLPLPFGPGSFLASEQKTELLKSVDGIVANCQFLADYMREWGGLDSTVLRFPAFGSPPFSQVTGARDGFVMFVNPSAMKGISIFLELARSLPEIRFATVPTWGTTQADRARLAELPNVTILNATDNIDDVFAVTRVLLVPSLWSEAVGYIGIEAMSRGIPVLGSDVGGMRESKLGVDYLLPVKPITKFEDRFDERRLPVPIVPEQDIRPWRDALVKLISDEAHYENISEASRTATLNFLSQIRVEYFEEYFASLSHPAKAVAAASSRASVPTQSMLDNLSPEKRALLALRLQRRAAKPSETNGIRRRNSTSAPLSFSQQGLWFLEQLEPNKAVYNIPAAIQLDGELNVAALTKTLEQIISRHEILRTTFSDTGAELLQTVAADARLFMQSVDLRSMPEVEQKTRAQEIMLDDARRSFDLVKGPPLRAILLCLSDTEHILLLTLHHIVSDGWSIGVLCREIGTLYESYLRNESPTLPDLNLQYSDFAIAQRERFEQGRLQKELEYWRKQLDGCPPGLDLPFDRQPANGRSMSGAKIVSPIPPAVWRQVEQLAERRNVTVFMLLMACFQTLLYRYTKQKDICVSSPIAGRNLAETENVIGCFVNTLVFRSLIREDLTFLELLEQVKTVALGAYAHQEFPFEKLVEELRPERKPNSTPFSTVMFALHNLPSLSLTLPGLVLKRLEREYPTAVFDLMLATEADDEGVTCSWIYSTDLFDAETIERLADHFQLLLQSVVANPDERLSELQFLAPAERRQLLYEWNETSVPRSPQLLHELFAQQAQATPEAVAVVYENQSLTYRELDQRSNQLAHFLLQRGVGPEVLVGICLERSLEMVVGLLSILKAGGAYVPLDPSYPAQRLAMMLEDSGITVLLTQQDLLKSLPAPGATIVCVDDDREAIARNSEETPACGVTQRNLAYMIFTSGSTGRPKGVQIDHAAVVNFLASMREEPGLTSDDVLLAVTSLSFDIAGLELFLPLVVGAREVLVSREVAADGTQLKERLNATGITVMQATPATYRLLLDAGGSNLADLKILCGGEAFPRELANQLLEQGATVWNMYGPTETTIWSAVASVEMKDGAVAIGRPIANTQLYLVDGGLQLVPPGVAGELCIGGDGLARGYFGAPALTAEKFIPNPFGAAGSRLYRTGDVARFRRNGELEYLGRFDEQIKLRGFRIELGEIEACLRSDQRVKEAAVLLADHGGEKQLVAFVVASSTETLDDNQLRERLKQQLPGYMLPATIIILPQLPLTANGKLDRKQLLSLAAQQPQRTRAYIPPRTEVEEIVAGIWSTVLNLEQVSIDDNFFELGGHSLLAMRLLSKMRDDFRVEVSLAAFLRDPTVANLSGLIAHEKGLTPAERIAPRAADAEPPLSFAQQRLWVLDNLNPGSNAYNVAGAVRLKGEPDEDLLQRSLNEVIRRHESLRTSFRIYGSNVVQVIAPVLEVTLDQVDLRHVAEPSREAELRRVMSDVSTVPFNLTEGPLFRFLSIALSDDEHVLLLNMHHIVSDAWSIEVLVKEVSALYTAYAQGHPSPLPELAIQYADYAVWQRQWLQGEVLQEQLHYWREQLQGAPAMLELPADHPRPAVQSFRGGRQTVRLDHDVSEQLQGLSRREGVTLFMTLLAAWQVLLSRYSGQEEVVVGSPIAGRTRGETEGLIGFFVNTLVLRSDLSGDPSFVELLQRVKAVCLSAYGHQEVPFEKLVEELQPERSLSHNPLFQVMFVLQNTTGEDFRLPGLELTPIRVDTESTKFDLTLIGSQQGAGLQLELEYNRDLFETATVQRMVGHFERVLESVVQNPLRRLSGIKMLGAEERRRLVEEYNDTELERGTTVTIQEAFEAQVARSPEATAVVWGAERVSYAELNERANQLGHYLQRAGVGPEVRVGLWLERSIEMVVAVLAVLKAGGAYVPLDPQASAERVAFMARDAGLKVVLQGESERRLPPDIEAAVINLSAERESLARERVTNVVSGAVAENLAYVIYTSGSTGMPKGVLIQHRSVLNLSSALQQRVYRNYEERPLRVGVNAPLTFDSSVKQLLTLLFGCTVYPVPEAVRGDSEALLAFVAAHELQVLDCTPSQLTTLIDEWREAERYCPAVLLIGGEAIEPGLWQQLQELKRVDSYNLYGPTECTVDATISRTRESDENPNIGRPVANTQVYLLDQHGALVPHGVAGELHIGGAGVGRGYLERAELTAARFIPNPFARTSGERLYRTGDLARYGANGCLEFLGRVDQQVKVRGFRIELEGIRALLNAHPAIHDSVVTVQQAALLVAYYVSAQKLEAAELREWLRQSLLEETIPGLFIHLKEMPLTANGKIDRAALPGIEEAREKSYSAATAPHNLAEEIVAGIWSDVLGTENLSREANFFELGGHSLLATQIVSRVRQAFAVELLLPEFFIAPTIAALANVVNDKLELGERATVSDIPVAVRNGHAPLSYSQQRLWFLNQLAPDSPFYNVSAAIHLQGSLDLPALERALNEVVRRHEVLRTSFPFVDGAPVQQINDWTPIELSSIDLSALSPDVREKERTSLEHEEARRIFDLTTGPLLSVTLLKLGADEYVVRFTVHHIISDGWSMAVMVREIASLYKAFASGQPSPLPELRIQYADYAIWQRNWLQGEVLSQQLAYWKDQLAGAPALLQLPIFKARPAVQSFRGAKVDFQLSAELSHAVRKLSGSEGVTLFITLIAAFQTLLYRYTGQTDILVGSPFAGRNYLDTEDLIGFFVNTVALRSRLQADMTFRQLLDHVRHTALAAHAHQDLPFERLVEELQPERNLSYSPVVQILFMLRNTLEQKLELPGLRPTVTGLQSDTAKVDLILVLTESDDGLFGAFEYDTELFVPAQIEQLKVHFTNLLQSIVTEPAAKLSQLPMLDEAERRELINDVNNTTVEYPQERGIHELFEEQAARTPHATAAVFADEAITYGELNRRANQLAHYLRRQGVGSETLVGIAVEPSVEMVVGLLAILKAGAAYVPLDPEYPMARLVFMIEDAGLSVLLTQKRLLDALSKQQPLTFPTALQVLYLDARWPEVQAESEENPAGESDSDNLAYVIYTSGSTGIPKGVSVPHRAVLRLVCNTNYVKLDSSTVIAQASNTSFDALTFELWGALLHGGRLVGISRELALSPEAFGAEIKRLGVNTLFLTTALFNQIARSAPASFASLRYLLFGGEAVDASCVRAVLEQGAPEQLLHVYGPTENTTFSSYYPVRSVALDAVTVPIGGPIANTQVYVLDQDFEPAPIGVTGELYVGGPGLARGYLRRPELTAERFVPDPFGPAGSRLYRTGDIVRFVNDREIEFLGRVDEQIKLRGFRIDLGEIEVSLRQDERVKDAVVLVKKNGDDRQIVGFVTPADIAPGTHGLELRERLKQQLPDFMVPSAIFVVSQLPITPGGKVNREALAAVVGQLTMQTAASLPPQTETEHRVAKIWSEVLNTESFGINDNFFDLGGHSLRAAQVTARINEVFDIFMPVRTMFERPTIANLADSIDVLRWLKSGADNAADDSMTLQMGEL